jgi:hypothetical protein
MGANAQTAVPTFTASQVLTAAQMNESARTGVPVFASTVTRDAAFGGSGEKTLAEGQLAYVEGTGLQSYNGSAWVTWGATGGKIVNVVSTLKTDTFSASTGVGTFTSVTGLTVAITPASASNKVLVIASVVCSAAVSQGVAAKLTGGNTATYRGDTSSNRLRVAAAGYNTGRTPMTLSLVYLDSPATASAITYGVDLAYLDNGSATDTIYCNRSSSDSDHNYTPRNASTITAIEVA